VVAAQAALDNPALQELLRTTRVQLDQQNRRS
jgi:hypothetical protein